MKLAQKRPRRIYLIALAAVTVIFLLLYHRFVFGGLLYAYSDIGADTINQYLPVNIYEINSIFRGSAGSYDLQLGLGAYNTGSIIKNLNPGNLPVTLFGEELLHVGLLVSMYLKYVLICVAALALFLRLFKNEKVALITALLWTFSSYNVLWGQHYQFLTTIMVFTVAVLGFHLYLEDSSKWVWTVLSMTLFAITSYYFLYMSCWFFAAYGVLYLAYSGCKGKQIAQKAGLFALMLIPAALMAAVFLAPAVESFLSSSRVSQVLSASSGNSLIYSPHHLASFAARLLSSDLIGTGNHFRGPINYYECAILSVSLLFLFCIVYLLQTKYWKRVLAICLACGIALIMPMTSRLLVFSVETQRWTYMLCFAQVLAIGYALKDITQNHREGKCRRSLIRSLLLADVLLALLGCGMIFCDWWYSGNWLSKDACIVLLVILAIYHGVFAVLMLGKRTGWVLLLAVIAEMVLCNYATVNHRDIPTNEAWYNAMYNDGTDAVVDWIQERDPGIYRINKTYQSAYYTDSLIQGYNGMGSYSSTNSAELLNVARGYGYSYARNWLGFDGTDLLANSMLGVKYIIATSDTYMDPAYFTEIYDDGTRAVHENNYALGFGFLYPQELAAADLPDATTLEKALMLSQGYYRTETVQSGYTDPTQSIQYVDLFPLLTDYYNCEGQLTEDGLVVTGTDVNMLLYFDLPQVQEGWLVSGVRVQMDTQQASNIKLFTRTDSYDFCVDHYDYVTYEPGSRTFWLDNTVLEQVRGLRLDVSVPVQNLVIRSAELILVNTETLTENLRKLQQTAVTDMTQNGNRFACTVENPYAAEAMLCVPLIYSQNWKVTVDNLPVKAENINAGLTGIPVSPGNHSVVIEYSDWTYRAGIWVSIASAAVFAVVVALYEIHRRKHTKAK